jgi:hypothetical protein
MITYDEDKRLSNLQKHGFDFIGAESIFNSFHITYEDTSTPYGEQHFRTLGLYGDVVVVMMVHTPRNSHDHVISIRKANKHEQRLYWQNTPN